MEFSRQLTAVAKFLLRQKYKSVEVFLHSPSSTGHSEWMAVVDIAFNESLKLKGTGLGDTPYLAFIKAIVELGENVLVRLEQLPDRNGLAGGLLLHSAIQRSKCELLERDAFLFHYRNLVSFKIEREITLPRSDKKVVVFRMQSASPEVNCFLATDAECVEGKNECILLGLGASADKEEAVRKAVAEYSVMKFDHELRRDWCKILERDPKKIKRIPDFHHVQSRGERNRKIFCRLCSPQDRNIFRDQVLGLRESWVVTPYGSPLRFFCYARVENKLLAELIFGEPEAKSPDGLDGPLYHPIW